MKTQMDLFAQQLGNAGRDAGIATAIEHAEAVEPGWKQRAYEWLLSYSSGRGAFTTMDCRKAAYAAGFPRPPTEFAWGGVVVRAVRAGVLVPAGAANIGDGSSHTKLTPLWRAARG